MQEIPVNMESRKRWACAGAALAVLLAFGHIADAQPAVVATAEGQLGETPGGDDKVIGSRFESIRGVVGEVLLGGIVVPGSVVPPLPEMSFLTDMIHGYPDPVPITSTPSAFVNVAKTPPSSAGSRNTANDGDFVAFSFAVDGAMPQTMAVRIATFDETGSSLINVPVTTVGTFPDATFNDTGVAVDNQGRVTVAYTELTPPIPPFEFEVKIQRLDALTGLLIGGELLLNASGESNGDVALLDPAGNRLVIATTDFVTNHIAGRFLDTTGVTPLAQAEFQVSTTAAAVANSVPAVAADPTTGAFVAVWENISGDVGDPINIRARRFDADGNPIGDDFAVNTTTAGSQGQPAVAYGPAGQWVAVWAGGGAGVEDLDVFGQAYDAEGNPIGGEFRANTQTENIQDHPNVRFLPEPDAQGQPQFVVAWRDVGDSSGEMPRGTGTSYKCFSIGEDPSAIFADGFESGETTSWSDSSP